MTPGAAKSRQELFWLPYPESNQVIINAHNFTPAETFAVNGKEPLHVWCPSKDTIGNGTTTLYDLIGSSNGTLVNMDAASDWVSDTSAGGVRALDFDGSNDYVDATPSIPASATKTLSCWFYSRSTTALQFVATADNSMLLRLQGGKLVGYCFPFVFLTGTTSYVANAWYHAALISTASNLSLYLNGSLEVTASRSGNVSASTGFRLAREVANTSNLLNGRVDDVRIWNQTLDSSDLAYLYNAGSGRGRTS